MAFDTDKVKKQLIANMGLSVRDVDGVPTYDTSVGDTTYSSEQIDRAILSAAVLIARTICETPGHPELGAFQDMEPVTYGEELPAHVGPVGVPVITPFVDAPYTITGKRKSIEEISAYRSNPSNLYSMFNHNVENTDLSIHSKLAGYYAFDANCIYFTGFSAEVLMAIVTEANALNISESRHELATEIAIMMLKMDGDISDIFADNTSRAAAGLAAIKAEGMDQPSKQKTIGFTRDSAEK